MKARVPVATLALALASGAWAYDYPTVDRVEYVLECLRNNGGQQEYLYKCSCAIDAIAKELPYEEYVESSTAARYQSLAGEQGGLFRDPEPAKRMAKKYTELQKRVKRQCDIK
ncbi:MAG TPA: hypothetical protein VF203_02615 [Burkholderiales bacterium]